MKLYMRRTGDINMSEQYVEKIIVGGEIVCQYDEQKDCTDFSPIKDVFNEPCDFYVNDKYCSRGLIRQVYLDPATEHYVIMADMGDIVECVGF